MADPAELAAKFGRTAVAGAKAIPFTGHGKDPSPLGTVNRIRGKRYVKVANGRPRYYSRDMLEDFDMFGDEPGYQYQWDGVEVEPTEAELADDAVAKAKAEAIQTAKETLKTAKETIRKHDIIGRDRVDTFPGGEVGSISLEEELGYSTYVPGDRFILTPSHIWLVKYNGADGDDWSCNNLTGSIGWAVPYDAELAETILSTAKLLNYRRKTTKGDPAWTSIETEHGKVWSPNWSSAQVLITWTPPEPIGGHDVLTAGTVAKIDGVEVVQFTQTIGKGKNRKQIAARTEGRPDLQDLVALSQQLAAELKAHYGDEEAD